MANHSLATITNIQNSPAYTRRKFDNSVESRLLMGMVMNDTFLDTIKPLVKLEYFTSNECKEVARFCIEYHNRYNQAIGNEHMLDVFNEEIKKGYYDETKIHLLKEFLTRLSIKYEETKPNLNADYLADIAVNYFKERAFEILAEGLQGPFKDEALDKFELPTLAPKNFTEGITLIEGMAKPKKKEQYIVSQMLSIPSFNALAARMKTGKSNMFNNLILNILTKSPFLNEFDISFDDNSEILLLDLENNFNQSLGEIRKIMDAQNLNDEWQKWGHRLIIQSRETWPIYSKESANLLRKIVKERPNIKLVILDTWKLFCAPRSDKGQFNYDRDVQEVNMVKNIALENNLCILTSVHLNKSYKVNADSPMDSIYGSTGFPSACDGLFALVPSIGKADYVLHGQGRYIADIKIALEKDLDTRSWRYLGQSDIYEMGERQADVYCFLQNADKPVSPKEISLELEMKVGSIDQILRKMVNQGKVIKSGYGKYSI